jgi:ribosomal protein S27E
VQPAFGASSAPAFGASSPFGASSAPAFGGLGAASAPAFGASSPFGASSVPAFGAASTPAFGASAGFGSSLFGASSAPAFGSSTPAFGSSAPAFGSSLFGTAPRPAFGAQPGGRLASQLITREWALKASQHGGVVKAYIIESQRIYFLEKVMGSPLILVSPYLTHIRSCTKAVTYVMCNLLKIDPQGSMGNFPEVQCTDFCRHSSLVYVRLRETVACVQMNRMDASRPGYKAKHCLW